MAPVIKKERLDEVESDACMRARLVESLSASFPGSALSRALHAMDEDLDIKLEDPLSSSCFSEIRLDKGPPECEETFDDDLTSLAWLQDSDLLKNITTSEELLSEEDDMQKENTINGGYAPQQHPPHVPYNPQKHINSKPPYSFSCLIFMAIEDAPTKKLPVKDIYSWILNHFPYFQNAPTGWKNSVRHNLSLNKCFKKVDKEKGQSIGKGSLWCIDPDYRPNLLQALRKTPYHPYHQLQMLANPSPLPSNYPILTGAQNAISNQKWNLLNNPSPHLFPFLSKRLAQSQSQFDSESDIDVANALVSLKSRGFHSYSHNPRLRPLSQQNGNRERSPSPPEFGSEEEKRRLRRKHRTSSPFRHRPRSPVVCTAVPYDDHSYSVSGTANSPRPLSPASGVSSIDEEYDFGHQEDEDVQSEESEKDTMSDDGVDTDTVESQNDSDYISPKRRKRQASHSDEEPTIITHFTSSKRKKPRASPVEEEEERKIVEGADALLNLAGIKTSSILPLRAISPLTTHNNNNNNNKTDNNA